MERGTVEIVIPPGIPQSVIYRVMEICGVDFQVKKDPILDREYPVLSGYPEQIEEAKRYLKLFTEAKLALRDIATLARRYKTVAKVYTEDEELSHVLSIAYQDMANKKWIEICREKPSDGEYEILEICGKKVFVYV
ncbi:MAG TPA: hypothetical protein EYH55_01665 [Methanothermococcus okinawensis]|uniref:Uncharacterized protein n=1 Tax=Methanothermococcus okinawensis TaxID=155863 RepID=A0A832ZXV3_9EURY|nr:hypothetical protein [Methanothermococcus okinawensis]